MRNYILALGLLVSTSALAQKNHTISGHVQDAESGEQLIGATLYSQGTRMGVVSNVYGFYSLTLPEGEHTVIVSFIGYTPQKYEIDLNKNIRINFDLDPGTTLEEAVVTGEEFNKIEDQVQMSKVEIPIDQIKRLPAIGGEIDIIKVLQLMPGVQSGNEGSSGLYVRGGSPDQNLMLLDGVPLYNVNHLFGFFSVFNADAVKNMTLTKGGFPARYGGRLSSILEINLKDGHMRDYHADGTISVIASKLTVEGPIVKDKASFMLSYRRTYLDLLMKPLMSLSTPGDVSTTPTYYFHDFNGKLNWKIGDKDRLYFSVFTGQDDFGIEINDSFGQDIVDTDFGLDWQNQIQALRWNHEWGPRLFSNTTLTHSKYDFNSGFDIRTYETSDTSIISAFFNTHVNDYSAKLDFDFAPNARNLVKFGANYTYHTFNPGATAIELDFGQTNPIDTVTGSPSLNSHEAYVYVEDEIEFSDRFKANVGLHGSSLFVQDTSYFSLQPRLALNYRLPGGVALKLSYAEMAQFVNLLTNEGVGLPTDLWVPSTKNVTPQTSKQIAAGVAKTFGDIEVSLEGYYKSMDGLLSYKEGASFMFDFESDWESKVTQGIGNSYGGEVLIQKKKGKTTGWIGYTLSWSNRRFDDINSGNWYPFTYDRRHDVSFVLNQEINDEWSGAFVWVYGTGRALTLSESNFTSYLPDGTGNGFDVLTASVPSDKNSFRMSPYNRADISLTRTRPAQFGEKYLIFSVYNLYNNVNPFFAEVDYDDDGTPVIREYGIFPIIPSVAWRYKF